MGAVRLLPYHWSCCREAGWELCDSCRIIGLVVGRPGGSVHLKHGLLLEILTKCYISTSMNSLFMAKEASSFVYL